MFFNVQSLPFLFEIAYLVYHKLLSLSIPFLKFFRFFSISFFFIAASATTRLVYHISFDLSIPFFNFFEVFFKFFEVSFDCLKICFSVLPLNAICLIPSQLPLSRTACLVYHILHLLSSVFFIFGGFVQKIFTNMKNRRSFPSALHHIYNIPTPFLYKYIISQKSPNFNNITLCNLYLKLLSH